MINKNPNSDQAFFTNSEQFDSLSELALNIRWSWNHSTDEIWRQVDSSLWDLTHNPLAVLQTVSRDRIREEVDGLIESNRQAADASMARLTPQFSASRAVRDYYLPAAEGYAERAADKSALGRKVVDWQHALNQQWAALRFGEMKVETFEDHHAIGVAVYCGDLALHAVRVELYADGVHGGVAVQQEMRCVRPLDESEGYAYAASVSAERPSSDYTARVIPFFPGVAVPLEAPQILWQR